MRLLDTSNIKLVEFPNPPSEYAILSHTWGDGEVTFQDLTTDTNRELPGWLKILNCCELAAKDGWQYVWIDTCCIDKSSSSELSEAINSMFAWYRQASICYVYMSDVACTTQHFISSEFCHSRWFTRGWTLQELLAPTFLLFMNQSWQELGSRSTLSLEVEKATGISHSSTINFEGCSVATRMSWAANRSTTRTEDQAYSLLGLFGINMALLYGEGTNAFLRLQLEILRGSDDESIFAWNNRLENPGSALFARSPSCFACSGHIEVTREDSTGDRPEFAMTNRGLRTCVKLYRYSGTFEHIADGFYKLELGGYKPGSLNEIEVKALMKRLRLWPLRCRSTQTRQRVAICLLEEPDGRFVRHPWLRLGEFGSSVYPTSNWKALPIQSIHVRDSPTDNFPALDRGPCTLALTFLMPSTIRVGSLDFRAVDYNKFRIYGPLMKKSSSFFGGQKPINFVPYNSTAARGSDNSRQHIDTILETEHSSALRFLQVSTHRFYPGTHVIICALLVCLWNKSPVIGLFQYHGQGSSAQLESFLIDVVIRRQDPQRLKDAASIPLGNAGWNLVAKCKPRPFPKERTDRGIAACITLSLERCETHELMSNVPGARRSSSFHSEIEVVVHQRKPDVAHSMARNEPSPSKKSRFLGSLRDRLRAGP